MKSKGTSTNCGHPSGQMEIIRKVFMLLVIIAQVVYPSGIAYASKAQTLIDTEKEQKKDPTLILTLGKGEVIKIDGPMSDVMIADPSIIDVQALQANRLYIVGTSLGDTNLIALDKNGNVMKRLNVHVRVDVSTIENNIKEFFPEEDVKVRTINDQIILAGSVSTPEVANKIQNFAVRFSGASGGDEGSSSSAVVNMMEVQGKQQVMLQVKVLELARNALKELGIETQANRPAVTDASGGGFDSNVVDNANDVDPPVTDTGNNQSSVILDVFTQTGLTAQNPFAISRFIRDTEISGIGLVEVLINALEDRDLVKTLAEPNLTSISGEEAGFLAGGEFPVPQGRSESGDIEVELQEFGVSINFRPVVLSEERISMQLATEVSSISFANGVEISNPPITVPGRSIRRANTTVEMGSGSTLMIAGLIQSETVKSLAGIPGLIDTPVIGELMKSRSFNSGETELVIMVTPYIVEAYKDKERVKQISKPKKKPLSIAFLDNLYRVYGDRVPKTTKVYDFGYLID